jgi:GntR family transcriptional regulator / MocR family aminotransferase
VLTYDLTQRGAVPLYEYLYQCIRQDIITGRLPRDGKLPSKRSLAEHLHVGVVTVANAYAQLAMEGYIRSVEKRGFFVEDVSDFRMKPEGARCVLASPAREEYEVDLSSNRNSTRLFPAATWARLTREALNRDQDSLYGVIPYNGVYELRAALANYLQHNRGMEVDPNQVFVGSGTEFSYGRLLLLFGREKSLAMENPSNSRIAGIIRHFGNQCHSIPIDSAGLRVDALEASGAEVVHLSPANFFPTGVVMPIRRRLELFEWVNRKKGRYIIEDDFNSEFRYQGRYIPTLYAEDTQNKVVYMNTFSKSLAPSLRISYMVLPPRLMQQYRDNLNFYSCSVPALEQYTLARFLEGGYFERHLNRVKGFYREHRKHVLAALAASPLSRLATVEESPAGTHLLLYICTELAPEDVRQRARERGIDLTFYSDYFLPGTKLPENGCRGQKVAIVLNYAGLLPDQVEDAVDRLAGIFAGGKRQYIPGK